MTKSLLAITRGKKLIGSLLNGRFAFLVVIGLVTYFWWPALWGGKLIVHGDAAHHGLSLLSYHSRVLAGDENVLWASRVYGGHPLFAEGQGGFANPLNIICAYFFEPINGIGVFHWLSVLVGAAGVYQLCRILTISRWSAIFASIAVVFSSSWIDYQHNLTVSATLAWVPWLMVAAEYWLKQPSLYRAALLAIPAALLVFAGYAQLAQGAAIYLGVSLLAQPFQPESRNFLLQKWRKILVTGAISVVLAIGLSAIQILPLMELVGQSHRNAGTELLFAGWYSAADYFFGLVFFGLDQAERIKMVGTLGNLSVVVLAGAVFFYRAPARIIGHALGVFLLLNLGMEFASPMFRFIYDNHVIPGIHYHRAMLLFFPVAIVGLAVLAAYALDCLGGMQPVVLRLWFERSRSFLFISIALYLAAIIFFCGKYFDMVFFSHNFIAPAAIFSAILVFSVLKRAGWIAPVAVIALSLDVLMLRANIFNFYDSEIVEPPASIHGVINDPQLQEYRVHTATISAAMVFLAANDPAVGQAYRRYVKGLSPFPGLKWKIPTINGVMALPMARKVLIDQVLSVELAEELSLRTKLRLMDILGVRYIALDAPVPAAGLSLFSKDEEQGALIYKNNWAKPRFQIYSEATLVDTPQDALAGLQAADYERLFIERTKNDEVVLSRTCIACTEKPPLISKIKVIKAESMEYSVKVEVDREAWLFLADANYPGWEATVNGQPRTVYSAQILGKAVRLDAGQNNVLIRYVPHAFYWGAGITVFSSFLVLGLLLVPLANYIRRPKGYGVGSVNDY